MPEFCIDVARVGNECAVPLFTIMVWVALDASRRKALLCGVILGLGLLSKAYFLAAIPALVIILRLSRSAVALGVGAAISRWWYLRNLLSTGTVSGLGEAVTLRSDFVPGMLSTNFVSAADAILLSHIWFGGWSSLTVRSWMYHVFYGIVLLAAIGLVRIRFKGFGALTALYGLFWLGQLYNAALLFLSKNFGTSMGWYMYAVIGAEVVLCYGGLRALVPKRFSAWIAPLGVILFGLLDPVYGACGFDSLLRRDDPASHERIDCVAAFIGLVGRGDLAFGSVQGWHGLRWCDRG
jgi:hypothetical protein